jgi:4-hydroxybenzoate polyprenyltransferase
LTTGFVDLFTLTLGGCVVFLIWQISVIVNDIYDINIDRLHNCQRPLVQGQVTRDEYKLLASVLSFTALSMGLVISGKVLTITLFFLGMALAYSLPPLRMRQNLSGHVLIGLSMFAAYLMGIYSSAYSYRFGSRALTLGVLISLFTMGLTLAKDIKDIEGDQKEGVRNLFTLLGKEKGKAVTTGFIFLLLNVPTLMFRQAGTFILSLLAVYLFQRFESIRAVYLIGTAVILLTVRAFFLS